MAILPIVLYGDPILRKKAKPVTKITPEITILIADMFETMRQANGLGLAAPQVGHSIRLLIVDVSRFEEYKDEKPLVVINPQIISSGGTYIMEEGCLSIPEVRSNVKRDETIKIKYRDEHFKQHTVTYDELVARVMLHEIDHLDGILFIDKISPVRLKRLKPMIEGIAKGNYIADYLVTPYVESV